MGEYNTFSGKEVTAKEGIAYTFAMHYDMGYTEARVEGYNTKANNGFSRHYVWARDWVLYLQQQ